MKTTPVSFMDIVYAYANLRALAEPTEREKLMIAGLEPHIYDHCTTLVKRPSPWMVKFGEVLKAFHAGDHEGVIKLMGELQATFSSTKPAEQAAPPTSMEIEK